MADETRKLIYEVVFDSKQAEERSRSLADHVDRLKTELAATREEFKKGDITRDEYTKSVTSIQSQLRSATRQQQENNKSIDDNNRITKSATGSLAQMRAQLSVLNKEYVEMSKDQRQAAETGVLLQQRIKALSDELKAEEEQLGNHTRSVGDYIKGVRVMGVSVGEAQNAFKEGYEATKVFAAGIATTRGALVALSAIPIVAFLVGLVAFLKATDEGADKLEQGMAFLSASFSSFMKGVAPLGKLLVDTFTSPLETIRKLVSGTDEYTVQLDKVAGAAIRAGLAQAEYTKTMQDLEDQQDSLIGVQAKVNEQVQLALITAKDRSKSERERISILDAAGNAERKLAQETVKIKKAEYDALKRLQSQKDILQDDDRKASREAYAEYVNARAASAQTEQQIQNRRSSLIEQEIAEQKSAAEKAKQLAKENAQERVYETERAILQAKRKNQETLSLEEELIRRQGAVQLVGLKKNSDQRKYIQAKIEADILKLRVDAAIQADQVVFATEQDKLSARLALVQKGSEDELALRKQLLTVQLDTEKAAVVDAAKNQADTVENRKATIAKLRVLDAKYNADTEQLDKSFAQAQVQTQAQLAEARLQTEQALGVQSLAHLRDLAEKRIDLEEQTQLKLLELEDISASQRLIKQNAIQAKAIAARRSLDRERLLDQLHDEQAAAETGLANSEENTRREMRYKIELLNANRKEQLRAENLTAEQRRAINAKADRAISDTRKEFLKKQIDVVTQVVQQSTQALDTLISAQSQIALNNLQQQQDAAVASAGLSAEMRADIEEGFAQKRIALEKEVAEKKRKIASIENIINTAASITKAFVEYGPILGAIFGAVALANGIAQQAVIDSQTFAKGGDIPKMGDGGVVVGNSHANGGVKYRVGRHNVELEGEEGVINKRSMRVPWIREMASKLNQIGGGVAFKGTSAYQPNMRFEYGGTIPFKGSDGGLSYNDMMNVMKSLPPTIVTVTDIEYGVQQKTQVRQFADIRRT